jgi:hypothetical protein
MKKWLFEHWGCLMRAILELHVRVVSSGLMAVLAVAAVSGGIAVEPAGEPLGQDLSWRHVRQSGDPRRTCNSPTCGNVIVDLEIPDNPGLPKGPVLPAGGGRSQCVLADAKQVRHLPGRPGRDPPDLRVGGLLRARRGTVMLRAGLSVVDAGRRLRARRLGYGLARRAPRRQRRGR